MYKYSKAIPTSIRTNEGYEGESIEQKVHRIVNNKEPIKDGAPLVYTERKDGVRPEYDIRTDKWELAVESMDKVHENTLAKRAEKFEKKLDDTNKTENKEIGGEKTDPKVQENKADSKNEKSGDRSQ